MRRSHTHRPLIALLAAFVALAPFLLSSPVRAQAAGECGASSGMWTTLPSPKFKTGGRQIVSVATDPFNYLFLAATNGTEVHTTGDGGCKWKKVYNIASTLPLGGEALITKVISPRPNEFQLLVQDGGPKVVFSVNGGKDWVVGGTGLPPTGEAEFIEYSTLIGTPLYVGVDIGGGAVDLLYSSADQGATFTLVSDLTQVIPDAGITGIELDPMAPQQMWAYGDGGLYESRNGGVAFQPVDDFAGDVVTAVDAWKVPGSKGRIIVFRAGGDDPPAGVSYNSGRSWGNILKGPRGADSAAHGTAYGQVMASANGEAFFAEVPAAGFVNANAPDAPITGITATLTNPGVFFGHTDTTIERYMLPFDGVGLPGIDIDVSIVETAEATLGRSSFGPAGRKIKIDEGKSKTVPYRLKMPPRPVPLDVYFAVDTSSSMTQPLAGIARSLAVIAQELENRRLDVRFGLVEYRSYPDRFVPRPSCDDVPSSTPGGCEANFLYRKLAELGTNPAELAAAIETLQPAAGGRIDAMLPALYTAVTGAAQDVHPVGGPPNENGTDVPPGQQAEWRPLNETALRVVLHVTDEPLPRRGANDQDTGAPSQADQAPWPTNMPTVDDVTAAFRESNIYHVGIALGTADHLIPDMKSLSSGTGAIAKREPVDCNGDGKTDIEVGEPLVCRVPMDASDKASLMVPSIVNLLNSIQETTEVSLDVTGAQRAVRGVAPRLHEGIVLQTANKLEYEVTFTCPDGSGGEEFPVHLAPVVEGKTSDALSVDATVVCIGEPDPIVPVEVLPLIAVPLIPAAPPPPAPVSNAQPVTQSQAQMQGAGATQEQEEPQLAMVTQEDELQEEELYAMVAYEERRSVPAEAFLGVGAVAVSLMYGLGLSMRRRTQLARNRRS